MKHNNIVISKLYRDCNGKFRYMIYSHRSCSTHEMYRIETDGTCWCSAVRGTFDTQRQLIAAFGKQCELEAKAQDELYKYTWTIESDIHTLYSGEPTFNDMLCSGNRKCVIKHINDNDIDMDTVVKVIK